MVSSDSFSKYSQERVYDTGVNTQSVKCDSAIDYNKLIEQFGAKLISPSLLHKFKELTGVPLHPLLRRGIFYSHKDIDLILDEYANGKPFYLYTGRGPSSPSMHLGHLLPFMFTQYLQKVFDVPVVIQMTDDEKFLYRDLSLEEIKSNLIENCKDIIACGYDPSKTFIFSNMDYIASLYPNILRVERLITNNQVHAIFGVSGTDNIGQSSFPAIQAAPAFHSSFPVVFQNDKHVRRCLIPCGIDQDPYFRMTRDAAPRMGPNYLKPALVHSKFFPALQGLNAKMSSSDPNSAIFMTDTYEQINSKILKYAFSGGRATMKEHRELGADLDVDVCYHYLRFFMEDDDEFETITKLYGSGELLTSAVKKRTVEVLAPVIQKFQEARSKITKEVLQQFMTTRPLTL